MNEVALVGAGVWAPGFADRHAWLARAHDPAVVAPAPGLLPPATARRATFLARMAADVLAQATEGAGCDPTTMGLVLGTGGGELQTTFACLELLHETPPASSPLRFRNSVHNAALGHLSIALGATGYASALAAHPHRLLAMALLEGWARVLACGEPTAVVIADEAWPTAHFDPLAVAFLLAPVGHPGAWGVLGPLGRDPAAAPLSSVLPPKLAANPSAAALGLLDLVAEARAAVCAVSVPGPGEPAWSLAWRREGA